MVSPTRKSLHKQFMAHALTLARRAFGHTSPNPLVGAVLVKRGRVIAEGYHRRAGLPHAEIEALRRAGDQARGATLYSTLEPCNHTGRTGPCCEAIIAAGVSTVVIAMNDPNPMTNGRGIARLRRAGIRVVAGILAAEARQMNAPFYKVMTTKMPWVIAKVGQSLDGKIATARGESRWITSAQARQLGHKWRARVDAILVGIHTVLTDDPRLTVRGARQRKGRPVKVIVDSRLRIPLTARCLSSGSSGHTIVATTVGGGMKRAALERHGAAVLTLPARKGRVPLRRLCRALVARGIQSMLIEGGGEVLASAFDEQIVDRVLFCIAPLLIGGRNAPTAYGGAGIAHLSQAIRLEQITQHRAGPDLCLEANVVYPRG